MVDDDTRLVRALLRVVEQAGHVGFGAHTLPEAQAIADREHLDVAIVDWVLEDCIGEDVCAVLRERSPRPSIAILTGSDDPDLPERSDLVGAIAFLKKPLQADDLTSLLRTVKRIRDDATSSTPPKACLSVDLQRRVVLVNEDEIRGFTSQQFKFLARLVESMDRLVSWEELRLAAQCNSIEAVHAMLRDIRRLFRGHRDLLETVRGEGVIMRSSPSSK
ncbi:MAG: response regulator [Polyangiaceae bacterium]